MIWTIHTDINDILLVGYLDCSSGTLHQPLLIVSPVSPLVSRFIREIAISRSDSFKNLVISGRSGRKVYATNPIITEGTP